MKTNIGIFTGVLVHSTDGNDSYKELGNYNVDSFCTYKNRVDNTFMDVYNNINSYLNFVWGRNRIKRDYRNKTTQNKNILVTK